MDAPHPMKPIQPRIVIAHRVALASLLALVGAGFALATTARAQDFPSASQSVDQRLTRALDELGTVRDGIAKEKVPLSRAVSELEEEVLTLRQQQAELLKVRDSRTIDLGSLRKQVDSLTEQDEFVASRLEEFVRDFEGRLDISELPRFEALTAAAKLAGKNANLDAEGRRDAQIEVVSAALGRVRDQLGGQIFAGAALSPDGVLTEGKFIALGPTVFFVSDDGTVSGLVESQLNAADPVVASLPGDLSSGLAALAEDGVGALPLDATLGKALKTEKARKTLRQYLSDGGPVGLVIVFLGLSALGLAIFKGIEIVRFEVADPERLDGILGELARGDQSAARRQALRVRGVAGEILSTGVENAGEKRGVLEELLFEKILQVRPTIERFLPFLAIAAAAAPLLGLLGTVTGMIKTFELITIFGTGDARSLSSGISEALVTTAAGLIVAIPALVVHGALSRMAKHKLGMLEQLSVAFVNGVAAIRHTAER
jgi:biopolymer transport protein ExbB